MPRRVLVLSASVGAGHLRAAQAVELALKELAPSGTEVRNVDVLTLTNAAFRKIYGEAYLDLVNKAPHVLGFFYDLMDRPKRPKSKLENAPRQMKSAGPRKDKRPHVLGADRPSLGSGHGSHLGRQRIPARLLPQRGTPSARSRCPG